MAASGGEAAVVADFAKLKAHLRKVAERSILALWDRIGTTLNTFSPQECKNFFNHVGDA
jgi:uncharacterized SAM-dependent methyltransferase